MYIYRGEMGMGNPNTTNFFFSYYFFIEKK